MLFDRDLKVALLSRTKRLGGGLDHPLCLAQDHLVERIVEIECNFKSSHRPAAVVRDFSSRVDKFLVQEIRGLRQFEVLKVNVWRVVLLCGAKGQLRCRTRPSRSSRSRQEHKAGQQQQNNDGADRKRRWKSALTLAVGVDFRFHCSSDRVQVPKESRKIKGSGRPTRLIRSCTASMLYGMRQNSTNWSSRSAIANPARGSPSRGWPIEPGFRR